VAELLYLDTSAFLKLIVDEAEHDTMWAALTGRAVCSSSLLEVEAHRALQRMGQPVENAERLLRSTALVFPTASTFYRAKTVGTPMLRCLDALHLATVLEIGEDIDAVATYDRRLAVACEAEGLSVRTPGHPDGWWRS
jgi:uncharacterized protein